MTSLSKFTKYLKIEDQIAQCTAKKTAIFDEITSVLRDKEMPIMPFCVPEGATPEEILELNAKNDPGYLPKLKIEHETLRKALNSLAEKKRLIIAEYSYSVAAEFQPRITAAQKLLALAFIQIQKSMLDHREIERDILNTGADGRGIDRHFQLNIVDDMTGGNSNYPDRMNAHQVNFYNDALNHGLITLDDIPEQLQTVFNLK